MDKLQNARGRNLLGAFVVAVNDKMQQQAEEEISMGGQAAAALVTIGHNFGESVEFLSGILQLSHSGCVRLVDKLAQEGLIERRAGKDRRSVALYLTETGQQRKSDVLRARRDALNWVFEALDRRQQEHLTQLIEVMLKAITTSKAEADIICRLCEERVCAQERCPVTLGAAAHCSM
ncbi:MAG: MarR family transcriptional regulator [Steroidobacteraceae bacterium]|jgi:DNA-binding MarR family transcriptional regulator